VEKRERELALSLAGVTVAICSKWQRQRCPLLHVFGYERPCCIGTVVNMLPVLPLHLLLLVHLLNLLLSLLHCCWLLSLPLPRPLLYCRCRLLLVTAVVQADPPRGLPVQDLPQGPIATLLLLSVLGLPGGCALGRR
jgi:hypothetical protein